MTIAWPRAYRVLRPEPTRPSAPLGSPRSAPPLLPVNCFAAARYFRRSRPRLICKENLPSGERGHVTAPGVAVGSPHLLIRVDDTSVYNALVRYQLCRFPSQTTAARCLEASDGAGILSRIQPGATQASLTPFPACTGRPGMH